MIKVSRGGSDRIQNYSIPGKPGEGNTSIMLRTGRTPKKMRNHRWNLGLGRFAVLAAFVVSGTLRAEAQIEKQIASIRSEVNLINKNAPKYDKKVKNIDGLSTEGSEVTYFISGRGLKKVVAKVYGETFRATTELYYSGEEPIFVFRRIERYDTQIGMTPPPKVIRVDETRLYRSGEKSIRILSGKTQLKAGDVKFTEAEYELIELSDMLKAAFDRG